MEHSRAHIRLMTNQDAVNFVSVLNGDGSINKYFLESEDSRHRVDARSLLGVLYFTTEHNDDTYLVNDSEDGIYPNGIDQFRV